MIKVMRKRRVFNEKLTSLKRYKDDVKEVTTEYECGIVCDKFSEFEVGDIIECYHVHEE